MNTAGHPGYSAHTDYPDLQDYPAYPAYPGYSGYQGVTLISGGTEFAVRTAELLLAQGQRVAVSGCDEQDPWRTAEVLGRPAGLLVVPGTCAQSPTVDLVLERFGRLDAVVARIGDVPQGKQLRRALPVLAASQGRIVLVGATGAAWSGAALAAEDIRSAPTASRVAVSLLDTGDVDARSAARAVVWVLNQPAQVSVDALTLRSTGQAA